MTEHITGMFTEDEYIEHYGVKGMQWGKRKDRSGGNVRLSADAARVRKIENRLKKNGPENLSNDDLAKLNKRNQLMSEYKKNNPSKIKRGQDAVKTVLGMAATATAAVALGRKIVTSPAAKAGAKIVSDIIKNMAQNDMGPRNAGEYVRVYRELTS